MPTIPNDFLASAQLAVEPAGAGPLLLAVDSTGSDVPTATRPSTLGAGDYTGEPFATIQAAVDATLNGINRDVTVTLTAEVHAAFALSGYSGAGTWEFQGTYSAAVVATGAQAGTAGAGTSPTSLVKPTAAANWTAADLEGVFVRVTSGPGAGEIRPVISNTTTTATIHAIAGLDNTSVFELVDPGSTVSGVTLSCNLTGVKVSGCVLPGSVASADNTRVEFEGCRLTATLSSSRDRQALYNDSTVIGGAVVVDVPDEHECNRVLAWDTGTITVTNAKRTTNEIHAKDSTTTPVSYTNCVEVLLGLDSSGNTGSGVLISGPGRTVGSGTGLVGTGNTGYGMDVQGGAVVDATGATITGTASDFRVGDVEDTWANLTTREVYVRQGTTIMILGG